MSVVSYNPNQVSLSLSEKAQRQIAKELAKRDVLGLRLYVEKSGCSGFRYKLDFVTEANDNDIKIPINEHITLFVSQQDQSYVNGTEIDFVTEGLNSNFQFRNPNASGTCGCGESFAVN
jgi:iron-sulfur cluster assembly protein